MPLNSSPWSEDLSHLIPFLVQVTAVTSGLAPWDTSDNVYTGAEVGYTTGTADPGTLPFAQTFSPNNNPLFEINNQLLTSFPFYAWARFRTSTSGQDVYEFMSVAAANETTIVNATYEGSQTYTSTTVNEYQSGSTTTFDSGSVINYAGPTWNITSSTTTTITTGQTWTIAGGLVVFTSQTSFDGLFEYGYTTPAALSTSTNNLVIGVKVVQRIAFSNSGCTLTGIVPNDNGSVTGECEYHEIINAGSVSFSVGNQSASSTLGNRFQLPGNVSQSIGAGSKFTVLYDPVATNWVVGDMWLAQGGSPSYPSLNTGTASLASDYTCTATMTATALSFTLPLAGTYLIWIAGQGTITSSNPGDKVVVGCAVAASMPPALSPYIVAAASISLAQTGGNNVPIELQPTGSTLYYVYASYSGSGTISAALLQAGTVVRWLQIA